MKQTVNERVKVLRTRLTKSQTEFANELEISVSLLSKMETGDMTVTPKMVEKINETYSIKPENWLMDGKGELTYSKPAVSKGGFDPARDTLYKDLKEEIAFYRDLLKQMAGKSFHIARNQTGLKRRLGAAA